MSNSPRLHSSRKTHPMVLVAATALTIFSLLGSAAITGLIPTVPYAKQGLLQDMSESKPSSHAASFENKASNIKSEQQTKSASTQASSETKLCEDCGVIVSINSIDQVATELAGNFMGNHKDKQSGKTAYLIKVRMENGGYRLITQYSQPQHAIGEIVKLDSNQLVSA